LLITTPLLGLALISYNRQVSTCSTWNNRGEERQVDILVMLVDGREGLVQTINPLMGYWLGFL
jgi:hypothetical protein